MEGASLRGSPFPKAEQWRKQIAKEQAEAAARQAHFARGFGEWGSSAGGATASPAKGRREKPFVPESVEVAPLARTKIVGRNDPCPCGSGKKYKKCCLAKK
jgi:uncharacterized protein YecA (UPF0149 family)